MFIFSFFLDNIGSLDEELKDEERKMIENLLSPD